MIPFANLSRSDRAAVVRISNRAEAVAHELEAAEVKAALLRAELTGLANLARGSGLYQLSAWAAAAVERGAMASAEVAFIHHHTARGLLPNSAGEIIDVQLRYEGKA